MDFIDYRKSLDKADQETPDSRKLHRYRGKQYYDYIDEKIREAEERGDFSNLKGAGKPLNLDHNTYAGDKATAYNLLKSNGYAPPEIELLKEINREQRQIEARLARLKQQSRSLRMRRVPPFASEKRAFNASVEKNVAEYERVLHELNRKILTMNLSTPTSMHKPMLEVERLVQQFRQSCSPFAL